MAGHKSGSLDLSHQVAQSPEGDEKVGVGNGEPEDRPRSNCRRDRHEMPRSRFPTGQLRAALTEISCVINELPYFIPESQPTPRTTFPAEDGGQRVRRLHGGDARRTRRRILCLWHGSSSTLPGRITTSDPQYRQQLLNLYTAQVYAKPERADALEAAYAQTTRNAQSEPGIIYYCISRDPENPDIFHFFERYTGRSAFEEHNKHPIIQKILSEGWMAGVKAKIVKAIRPAAAEDHPTGPMQATGHPNPCVNPRLTALSRRLIPRPQPWTEQL